MNHIVELLLPWLLLFPRKARMVGGACQIAFQAVLITSGNLSFLNWLTIAPAIWCFDDASLVAWFPKATVSELLDEGDDVDEAQSGVEGTGSGVGGGGKSGEERSGGGSGGGHSTRGDGLGGKTPIDVDEDKYGRRGRPRRGLGRLRVRQHGLEVAIRRTFAMSLLLLLAYLSKPVVENLLSSRQAMNTSFDVLKIVNTYGAFGSITKKRTEVVLQGSHDGSEWRDYEFKCKVHNT